MALHITRIFSWLLAISAGILIFLILKDNFSINISWATLTGKYSDVFLERGPNLSHRRWSASKTTAASNMVTRIKNTHSAKVSTVTSFNGGESRTEETPMPLLFVNSFKKLPVWDFEDVYNQDAPLRQNTCAESLRNSNDEGFRKAFLPNIRLFLHKNNINMSEWNRLSHFNNPFGFMQYKYDDVMAAVKLIPEPKEPLLSPKPGSNGCIRCAVVGTAGILSGSKMGKEIDGHDYVFRMNAALTKGYEEDVGNRTSVYVHTAHSITASLYYFKKYGYKSAPYDEGIKYVMIPEGMRDYQWLQGLLKGERVTAGPYKNARPRTYYQRYNESSFYVLHQDFLRYNRNRFLRSPHLNNTYWAIVRPTNGAFTLLLALHVCDVVSAYGFMTEDYKEYFNYYFERGVKTRVIFYANHDYVLEKNLWKKLHDSKILKLYQRTHSESSTPEH